MEHKSRVRERMKDAVICLGLLLCAVAVCMLMRGLDSASYSAQLVFVLAVLLISRFTNSYVWGVLASIFSVVAVNYAFTYPFFSFNLSISGYLLTFLTMLTVSLIVGVLTTRIKQQERLRVDIERERLRADLLRAVSHDLRTPLTSIIGSTGVILENELPPDKQRELIQDANADAQWLLRMIENLLAVTRVSKDAQPLLMQTEVVEEVLADAVIKFQKHFTNIRVDMEMADEILLADMEPMLIGQVTTNLLENAAYHGVHTTRICLRVFRDGRFVKIEVSDDGVGVPPERLPRIFAGDTAGDQQRGTDARRGMGIGLSVCMSIVKAHGGTMTAKNNESGGATFAFTLPEKENDYVPAGTDTDH